MARRWKMVPQEVKERGEVVGETNCKRIKFFPKNINKQGQPEGFGVLGFPCFRVLITPVKDGAADENDKGKLVILRWSKTSNKMPEGRFSIEGMPTFDYPPLKDASGRLVTKVVKGQTQTYKDTLADKEWIPGNKTTYDTPRAFAERLAQMTGKALAGRIIDEFRQAIIQLHMQQAERTTKKMSA